MNTINTFFQDNWKIMLIGLVGVALGVFLNWYFGIYQNRQLLDTLTEELKLMESKTSPTVEEKDQIQHLKGEIYILKFKC